jgi:hypothetical protein
MQIFVGRHGRKTPLIIPGGSIDYISILKLNK